MATVAQALSHGWNLQQAGRVSEAETVYRQVLQAAPDDANAWCYLGMALHDQDRFEEAVDAYQRAIKLHPEFPIAFNNLGNTLRLMRRLDDALASFDRALALKPDYLNAWKNKGTALVWEGHLDAAVASYQQALQLAPNDAETHKNLGVIWLLQGKFEPGWREYAFRWQTNETTLPNYAQPLWDGSPLDGKTILLAAEQGLGDTVHFIRYANVLKQHYDCRVIAACQAPLLPLLATCEGIDQLVDRELVPPDFDVFVPLLNIPGILNESLDTIPGQTPYLFADASLTARWEQRLSVYPGLKVGIAWQGNPDHQADRMRSVPLSEFAPLGQVGGVRLFSLQKGHGREQLADATRKIDVVDFGPEFDASGGAFMDTAAVLKNLDLLITSDTAIAHVAGALGVPVWVVLSYVPDWRWLLDRDDSPWYPTMRLFRQPKVGDWASVFQEIAGQLERMAPMKPSVGAVRVDISPGELIDKITILAIKSERITDEAKLHHVSTELKLLEAARDAAIPKSAELERLTAELRTVNEALWDIEDAIRDCERRQNFDEKFVALARSVYHRNDERAALKREINDLLGATLIEEKSYREY